MRNVVRTGMQPQARWAVVNTQPQREAVAMTNLEQQGFEPYLPRIARVVRHARRVTHVRQPMFPCYMFARVRPDQQWRPILGTYGVSINCNAAPHH